MAPDKKIKSICAEYIEQQAEPVGKNLSYRSVSKINVDADVAIAEIASQHLNSLCKKICYDTCYKYQCTLDHAPNKSPAGAPLCEWGNGSYNWIISELRHIQHQNILKDRKVVSYEHYFRKIVTSIQFWERYKNWRFKRRIRVPDYIKALDRDACKVFWGLYEHDAIENIAQRLNRKENEIRALVGSIYSELHTRKRTYILLKNTDLSLSDVEQELSEDIYTYISTHASEEELELRELVMAAYKRLTWQEQYILDVMVIDNLSAIAVLKTLKEQSIYLEDKLDPKSLNIQKVYYFLRKTIAKLALNSNICKE